MKQMKKMTMAVTAMLLVAGVGVAFTEEGGRKIREFLNGVKEVPVISTTGSGTFKATIKGQGESLRIEYELTYQRLEGTVTQAHIHVAPPQNAGGISAWLCQTTTRPHPTPDLGDVTPTCPPSPSTDSDPEAVVEGTIRAADVIGPADQGIAATELAELVALIRAGKTYANVHSTKIPGGEIRSQLRANQ